MTDNKIKGYLANGLFSLADRMLNELLAQKIRERIPEIDLYVPQENDAINDKTAYADSIMIADADDERLLDSDIMVTCIDGVEIDSGNACEIGVMATLGKPIFALYTDVRLQGNTNMKKLDAIMDDPTENQFMYRNLYVIGKIKKSGGGIYHTIDDLVYAVELWAKEKYKKQQNDI